MANKRSAKKQAMKDIYDDLKANKASFMAFTLVDGHILVHEFKKEQISFRDTLEDKVKGYAISAYCLNSLLDMALSFNTDCLWMLAAAMRMLKRQKGLSQRDRNDIIKILFNF